MDLEGYQFYVVGSALYKKEPRDVDIFAVMDDWHFKSIFKITGSGLINNQESSVWREQNLGAIRVLQSIFPKLIPIDFKYIPRSILWDPKLKVDITTRPETWGIGFPNLTKHQDEMKYAGKINSDRR